MNNIESILKKELSFWDSITKAERELIINNSSVVSFDKGENIYSGNFSCEGIMIVKSGRIRTYLLSEDGREVTLYILQPDNVCVMSAPCIIENISFNVLIDADEDSQILMINLGAIKSLRSNVHVENYMLKEAMGRFSDVMWAMEQILFLQLDQRLAQYLLTEIERTGSTTLSVTHEEIAKYLGSAREAISRMLKIFSDDGYVKLGRGKLEIVDTKGLESLL